MYQDKILLNPLKRKFITLEAGYGEDEKGNKNLTLVCFGTVQQCYSERNGVDFVTNIEVIDPDILNEYTSVTFQAGTTFEEAYKFLASRFPNLKQGELGEIDGVFKKPTVFDGNSMWVINELTGGHTFIDNGVLHTLNDNETLQGYKAYLISSETGLLGTPKRYDAILEIRMLFEPTIRVGQLVEIKSETWSGFNGQYKVIGYNHNCIISGSADGTRTTTLQLQYIEYLGNSNVNLTNNPEGSVPVKRQGGWSVPINMNISAEARQIYKYIKAGNWDAVMKAKITDRVSWKEMLFASSNNTKADIQKSITEDKLNYCYQIAINLTNFLTTYFKGKTITIASGYRTPQSNSRIERSANNSNHIHGKAIDFTINGVGFNQYATIFNNKWKLGLGVYNRDRFLHVSTDPKERFSG